MLGNPDMLRQIMDSPLTQSLMSNPEIMRSLIQANPQMQQVTYSRQPWKHDEHLILYLTILSCGIIYAAQSNNDSPTDRYIDTFIQLDTDVPHFFS